MSRFRCIAAVWILAMFPISLICIPVVAVVSVAACAHDPFVGPATVAPACPVDCRDGTCCHYGLECHNFKGSRTCEPVEDWMSGARRDAGVRMSEPRYSK